MLKVLKRLTISIGLLALPTLMQAQQFKVVGYLTNWGADFAGDASKVDYTKVTHINIAFINPNSTGTLGPTTSLSTVVTTIHNNNAKVLASLGGAGAGSGNLSTYWTNLMQPANRAAFITKIVDFVDTYNLDGIDVDLEDTKIDDNYEGFVTDLRAALKPKGKLITAAVAKWEGGRFKGNSLAQFDFVNIMSYDAYGTWTGPGEHSPYSMAVTDLNYFASRGLTQDKMVVGVPSYGYYWNGTSKGTVTYCSMTSTYPRATTQDTIGKITGPGAFYSFNGIPTIKDKTALALSKASGVMMWTLQMDCPTSNSNSLLKAISEVINQSLNNIPPVVSITAPSTNSTFDETQTITFTADASDSDGSVSDVSFYLVNADKSITKIGGDLTSPYSFDWVQPGAGTYKIFARALDNVPGSSNSDTITIVVNPATTEVPYLGNPWPIPGKIEAENYDIGSTLAYSDLDAGNNGGAYRNNSVDIEACNEGGFNVGWTNPDEWINYTVDIAKDSTYDITARVSSPSNSNSFSIQLDDQTIDFNIPNTGGWQNWKNATVRNVSLTKGQKIMKILMGTGNFNINYVNVVYYDPKVAGIFGSASKSSNITVYPNPFQSNATIKVDLPSSGQTEIILFDMMGRPIKTINNSYLSQGTQQIAFDGSDLPKGFYICKIVQEEKVMTVGITKE